MRWAAYTARRAYKLSLVGDPQSFTHTPDRPWALNGAWEEEHIHDEVMTRRGKARWFGKTLEKFVCRLTHRRLPPHSQPNSMQALREHPSIPFGSSGVIRSVSGLESPRRILRRR